jgi:membrane-associated phospholipid phosphatase
MMDLIVGIITAFAIGFVLLWILRPSLRKWVERPKYTVLRNDQRFKETEQKRF